MLFYHNLQLRLEFILITLILGLLSINSLYFSVPSLSSIDLLLTVIIPFFLSIIFIHSSFLSPLFVSLKCISSPACLLVFLFVICLLLLLPHEDSKKKNNNVDKTNIPCNYVVCFDSVPEMVSLLLVGEKTVHWLKGD